ncbi:hypothetical protein evm_002962 [Chilo suppressalis]|nr:hypothetical protein evm_002962 [Chilo suppressalis]
MIYQDANSFLINPILPMKYSASIPEFDVTCMGMLSDVPTEWEKKTALAEFLAGSSQYKVSRRRFANRWRRPKGTSSRELASASRVLYTGGGGTGTGRGRVRQAGRTRRRGSAGGAPTPRSPSLQLALELQHRASTPGSAGGKQVAVVQPQRRDTPQQNGATSPRNSSQGMIERNSEAQEGRSVRGATKAWIWIESRKTSPRAAKVSRYTGSILKHQQSEELDGASGKRVSLHPGLTHRLRFTAGKYA